MNFQGGVYISQKDSECFHVFCVDFPPNCINTCGDLSKITSVLQSETLFAL